MWLCGGPTDDHTNVTSKYTYDMLDRKVSATDPRGFVTRSFYDADSRTTKSVQNCVDATTGSLRCDQATTPDNQSFTNVASTTAYDAAGNTTLSTDPKGNQSVTHYDALNQAIEAIQQSGDATPVVISDQQTGYDEAGDVISAVVDPSGKHLVTSTTYDGAGRKQLVIAPPANPNTTDPTDPNGVSNVTTYTYDADGNVTDTRVTNSRVSTTGNIVGETTVGYNGTGTLGVMAVYSDAAKTRLAYKATFGYDAGTRTSTLTDLVGPAATALHNYSYSYDTANNITSVADAVGGASSSYTYDNLNQLKTVTDGTGTTTFSYDANHNRKQMVATVGTSSYTTTYTYDAQADTELLSKTDPSNKTTVYTYDAAGDLTQAVYDPTTLDPGGANQTTTYGYDTRGRLTAVTQPNGTTISFTYDADGNRASKTVTTGGPAPTVTTVRDVYQVGRIAYQTDGAGTTLATFTYDAGGMPASVQVGSDLATAPRYYYIYNAHGDVVALVDAAGNTVATYSYDVFGGVTASESLLGGWSNPYRYDGADRVRYDSETSLYWMSVRAYDPTLGRFLSRDPLGRVPLFGPTTQPYVYAGNNPLTNVDPSGQWFYAGEGDGGGGAGGTASSGIVTTPGGGPSNDPCITPQSPECRSIKLTAWKAVQKGKREDKLRPVLWGGITTILAGFAFTVIGDWLLFKDAPDIKTSLGAITDIAANVISTVPALLAYLFPEEGPARTILTSITAAAQAVQGIVQGALSLYYQFASWGSWIKGAINTARRAIAALLGGAPGAVESLAEQYAGAAFARWISASGHGVEAIGFGVLGDYQYQIGQNIEEWCGQNPGTCEPMSAYGL